MSLARDQALDELPAPARTWRRALPRIGLSETSELPLRHVAALLASAGERVAAVELYREIVDTAPDDVDALERLAAVLARLGRYDDELAVRRRLADILVDRLGIGPEDREAVIAFELASHGFAEVPPAPPAAFVAACFDVYASKFDHQLRTALRYLGPEQVMAQLTRALGAGDATLDICDAGCGTGLLGPHLRPHARHLDGIDVSPGMLEKAHARGVYDALVAADLVEALRERPGAYDVITAADVFVYLGDLGTAFTAIAGALRPGGLFVFTVERAEGEGYVLNLAARYAHSAAYVRGAASAAGLVEIAVEDEVLRRERATPVYSLTCTFRKPSSAGGGAALHRR
jgi:predicted TPR repeat methyltransferase